MKSKIGEINAMVGGYEGYKAFKHMDEMQAYKTISWLCIIGLEDTSEIMYESLWDKLCEGK